ncbi:MAG: hypothetical protein AAF621_06870 [Pseudomonadota bacterium]
MAGSIIEEQKLNIITENDIKNATDVGAFIVGAGLGGMSAALALFKKLSIALIEKGSEGDYRAETPSQGSLRGAREVCQPEWLMEVIKKTRGICKELDKTKPDGFEDILYHPDKPYLMCVKSTEVLKTLKSDLDSFARKNGADEEQYKEYTAEGAREQFGIDVPEGYTVLDVSATASRLNITALEARFKHEMDKECNHLHYDTDIVDYVKAKDGYHFFKVKNSKTRDEITYKTNQPILAPGRDAQDLMQKLHDLHNNHLDKKDLKQVHEKQIHIPELFKDNNIFTVPQKTLYVKLSDEDIEKIGDKIGALYMLDTDHNLSGKAGTPLNRLGVYMFIEEMKEMNGKKALKIGYDPMPFITKNKDDPKLKELFDKQKELMFLQLQEIFGHEFSQGDVLREDICEYPISDNHHPEINKGKNKDENGFLYVVALEGYGAMATAGAVSMVMDGKVLGGRFAEDTSLENGMKDMLYTKDMDKAISFVDKSIEDLRARLRQESRVRAYGNIRHNRYSSAYSAYQAVTGCLGSDYGSLSCF